ncbi:MAG: phosphoribosylformylglycinamidine synthase subunit PurS [Actinomycetota bacterium]|jgi:phosphoribosylformylglycinamidine synthase|nr:phosphoribosylformylglycinamidine synthase subunit PurS [Actinomycetota bacterium]
MAFTALVSVMPKPGVADPQGQTIEGALPVLGYTGVHDVRVGKRIELQLEAANESEARQRVVEMCDKLLANPVIESYEVTIR